MESSRARGMVSCSRWKQSAGRATQSPDSDFVPDGARDLPTDLRDLEVELRSETEAEEEQANSVHA